MYKIYKTTNTINNKYYIGVHNGNDKWYKGSGTALKRAIKLHGGENFVTETLEECTTEQEAFVREAELVTEELVKDRNCYNIKLGGKGGAGTKKSEAHKEAIRQAILEKGRKGYTNPNAGSKPKMDKQQVVDAVEEHGLQKAALLFDVEYHKFKHRYYRYKKSLPG
jgi:hypothetical protein|tara:strand:- start:567 stop:1064 length:498 start_codon:yes stop_codon:yes gene_type:complete